MDPSRVCPGVERVCPYPTNLQNPTREAMLAAFSGSTDPHLSVKDITVPSDQKYSCLSGSVSAVGANVTLPAGGGCWQHTHPDQYDVYDIAPGIGNVGLFLCIHLFIRTENNNYSYS